MKIFKGAVLSSIVLLPTLTLAQDASAGPSTFHGSYSLWGAIIIGLIASVITFYNATKLGGTISRVLWLFGLGMFLVVLGFISVVVAWTTEDIQKIVHDTLFIIGYILMTFGGTSLYNLNKNIS